MRRIEGPFRVYLGFVPTGYLSPEAIRRTIRDGIVFCGGARELERLPKTAKIIVKADLTAADSVTGKHTYTHPEITAAVLAEIESFAGTAARKTVLAECGPDSRARPILRRANGQSERFRARGYYELEHAFAGRVAVAPLDETAPVRYRLSKDGVLPGQSHAWDQDAWRYRTSNELTASGRFADADFAVYCPKLRTNVLSHGFSGAIRLGSLGRARGVLTDRYLCDLLEVCNPRLVVTDAIIAAIGGGQRTQRGHELGAILVANNALAHDWIAAQILNLDPMKIEHLRIAAQRGWGPANRAQIELGGAGDNGVRQLGQKSRFWDLGLIPVGAFADKFERENPGLRFPLEILSGAPCETAGDHGMLLEWLYGAYDAPQRRAFMARWPKATVCVGPLPSLPSNFVVYAVGDRAIRSIDAITSENWLTARLGRVELALVQLKNGRRHLIARLAGSPPADRTLDFGFGLASLGRMILHRLRPRALVDALAPSWIRGGWARAGSQAAVMTSRLPQNAWWALRPVTSAATRAAVETSVFSPR